MATPFGRFPSFEAFIDSYEAARQAEEQAAERGLTRAAQRRRRRRQQRVERDVVEVSARIRVREADDNDGSKHHRLLVTLVDIFETDPDVDADLQRCLSDGSDVFVAIRFGDRMGIRNAVPGLDAGAEVDLKGEYIPRDRAQAHGGERVSVLHFTHHPVGFVVTADGSFS